MFGFPSSEVPETTTITASKILSIIQILGIIQVCISMLNITLELWSGITMLMGASILFLLVCYKNWCLCVIYIVLSLFDLLSCILALGQLFTKVGLSIYGRNMVFLILYAMKTSFYMVSIFYAFLEYRELKAILADSIHWSNSPADYGGTYNIREPFSGRGYRLRD